MQIYTDRGLARRALSYESLIIALMRTQAQCVVLRGQGCISDGAYER